MILRVFCSALPQIYGQGNKAGEGICFCMCSHSLASLILGRFGTLVWSNAVVCNTWIDQKGHATADIHSLAVP